MPLIVVFSYIPAEQAIDDKRSPILVYSFTAVEDQYACYEEEYTILVFCKPINGFFLFLLRIASKNGILNEVAHVFFMPKDT